EPAHDRGQASADDRDASGRERSAAAAADGAAVGLLALTGQEVDGAHQSSTPSPIAIASEARSSRSATPFGTSTRDSGSAGRTRTRVRRSSSETKPESRLVPPATKTSAKGRAPGWPW